MGFREAAAQHFHSLVQIPRSDVFGSADTLCAPINLSADASTMFAGYIGSQYEPGAGLLLLAINPGGGGDQYASRSIEDEEFYPHLYAFKRARGLGVIGPFERINESFVSIVQHWNLWRILRPTLEAAGVTIDQVAYMNVVPYRTRGDKMPPSSARQVAWRLIVEPTLAFLNPKAVITLGKKAGSVVEKLYEGDRHLYCVPRTIGDSWVSKEALAVHKQMRSELV